MSHPHIISSIGQSRQTGYPVVCSHRAANIDKRRVLMSRHINHDFRNSHHMKLLKDRATEIVGVSPNVLVDNHWNVVAGQKAYGEALQASIIKNPPS